MTDQKSNLHAHRESQLKSGFVKLKEHLKKIETCIERPDRHLYEQKMATKFKKLQKYTEELEKLLSPTGMFISTQPLPLGVPTLRDKSSAEMT